MAKKKRKRRGKGCGRFLLLAILLLAIYITALFLPVFDITDISVSGNTVLKSETVIKECTLAKGQNIFRVSTGKAKRNILKMPYVKEVKVKRKLPSKIVIEITEEVAEAYIVKDKNYIAINADGKVLEVVKKPKAGIMQIPGMKVSKNDVGEIIEYKNENAFKLQMQCVNVLRDKGILEKVAKLDIANSSNIKITFDNGLVAEIGNNEEIEYKIKMIETVLGEGYGSGIFNIANTAQPTYRKNK